MPKKILLVIDIGTSSIRAALFDTYMNQVGECIQKTYKLDVNRNGKCAIDPKKLLGNVIEVIDKALFKVPNDHTLICVSLSTFWHSLVGIAQNAQPTTPILTWADYQSSAHAKTLRDSPISAELHRQTGCPIHSTFWPARLIWLSDTDPAAFSKTRYWLSAADYLFLELFGKLSTSISMASGTGVFDLNRLCWNERAIQFLHLDPATLPVISDEPNIGLNADYAKRWPQLANIPWFPAKGDGACSSIGAGCMDDSMIALMIGTSGSIRIVWEEGHIAINDPGMWCFRINQKRFVGGMALSEGGNAVAWARDTLNLGNLDEVESITAAIPPDTHGLTVLPYFLGSRSPTWVNGRKAVIAGITIATTPLDIYRAVLESVAIRFTILKRRLDRVKPGSRRIVATGGALLKSSVLPRILADCLGEAITVSGVGEGSLYGAAVLALEQMGCMASIHDWDSPVTSVVSPNPRAHEAYVKAIERHDQFDKQLLFALDLQ